MDIADKKNELSSAEIWRTRATKVLEVSLWLSERSRVVSQVNWAMTIL